MKELVITRVVDAPRELVFRAWTEREHLDKWFGPVGFTMFSTRLELKPGGAYVYGMRAPGGGGEMWGRWIFREIEPPSKLVFVSSFSNEEGEVARAPFSEKWPLETLSTVTFVEEDGKTRLTLRGIPINASEAEHSMFESMFPSMQQGWGGTFNQLDAYVKEMR